MTRVLSFQPADVTELGIQKGDLRVRLADRSLRQTNPLLGVLAESLRLATARVTAAEVLDLGDLITLDHPIHSHAVRMVQQDIASADLGKYFFRVAGVH